MTNQDPDKLYFEEYVERYKEADKRGSQSLWERADIALQVETIYGLATLDKFAELTGDSLSTIKTYRWVAKRFPTETRNLNVSFRHHQVLAAMEDRQLWLKRAEAEKLSVGAMLDEIKPNRVQEQNKFIEDVAKPKPAEDYSLRELEALDREDLARVMAEAKTKVRLADIDSGLTMEHAAATVNWWMRNSRESLLKMDILAFLNTLFEDFGSFSFNLESEMFEIETKSSEKVVQMRDFGV